MSDKLECVFCKHSISTANAQMYSHRTCTQCGAVYERTVPFGGTQTQWGVYRPPKLIGLLWKNVIITASGMGGVVVRIVGDKIKVKVKSRWGNHHHPVTEKTFTCTPSEVDILEAVK